MKKLLFCALCLLLLSGICGCEEQRPSWTGEYGKNRLVTLTHTVTTDIPYPEGKPDILFEQGFARYPEAGTDGARWNAIDAEGNRLLEEGVAELTLFNHLGYAGIRTETGECYEVDSRGNMTRCTTWCFADYNLLASDLRRKKRDTQYIWRGYAGTLEDGFSVYVREKTSEEKNDAHLGIKTQDEYAIFPCVPFCSDMGDLHINEDKIVFNDGGYIAILTLTFD